MYADYNGTEYYFVLNLQGNVMALVNETRTAVVEYTYDAWGAPLSATGTLVSSLGQDNSLRYRGYVFDQETGLYYLQSRYYNPEIGRFLNADAYTSTGQGILRNNMFAYCGNNPANRSDPTGLFWGSFLDWLEETVSDFLHRVNNAAVAAGYDTAAGGAPLLDMYESSPGVYHADPDCWQQYAGYNFLYDFFFDLGTSMAKDNFDFTYDGVDYIIWVWKGDYINLGAGAELGIYYGGGPHWLVDTSLAMPMSLSLSLNGQNIINHQNTTWWMTGFNSNYLNVQAGNLSAIFTIYFNSPGMYNAFASKWNGRSGWTCNPNTLSATLVF